VEGLEEKRIVRIFIDVLYNEKLVNITIIYARFV